MMLLLAQIGRRREKLKNFSVSIFQYVFVSGLELCPSSRLLFMDLESLLVLLNPRTTEISDIVSEFFTAADYHRLSHTCTELRVTLIVPSPWRSPRLFAVYNRLGYRISDAEVSESD